MLLNVQVTNTGENLITVGDDGLLRPDLWVDAQLRGVAQQPLPAVAFDRLGGPLVLKRGETASQVVRVDGGQLAQLIGMNPMAAVQIQFQVTTNPTSTAQRFGPGPAGYAAKSQRLVERSGAPMESESLQRRIADTLAEGTPEQKVRTLDLVAAYAAALAGEGDAEGAQAAAQSFREFVRRATGDADPNVRAWAAYRHASLVAPPDRAAATERLAGDEHWVSRVLAAALAHEIGPGAAADVARKLAESDADPVVRAFATAAKQLPPPAPATQPATAPAPVPPPSLPSSPQR